MSPADREHRLRERIDTLTDERDNALDALAKARALSANRLGRITRLAASRDLWRHRAIQRTRFQRW